MHKTLSVSIPLFVLLGCAEGLGPDLGRPEVDLVPHVVGPAAQALTADGRFPRPTGTALGWGPVLTSRTVAEELARAYLRTFVANPAVVTIPGTVSLRDALDQVHGHPVDWSQVEVEPGGAFFSNSVLDAPPADLPETLKRFLGPAYLVPFRLASDHVATVVVSALEAGLWVDSTGWLRRPLNSGNEIQQTATRHSWGHGIPLSPEEAVRFAATEAGTRVREVPTLMQPRPFIIKAAGTWRVILEQPRRFQRISDDRIINTDTVYVSTLPSPFDDIQGDYMRLMVPADEQPREFTIPFRDQEGVRREYAARVNSDTPVHLHEVRVLR